MTARLPPRSNSTIHLYAPKRPHSSEQTCLSLVGGGGGEARREN